jgi:hypothetical protein
MKQYFTKETFCFGVAASFLFKNIEWAVFVDRSAVGIMLATGDGS